MTLLSFLPIANDDAEILILGSMPGIQSLAAHEYYAHPRNSFWRIIYAIYEQEYQVTYSDRLDFIRKNKIALWDVVKECERKGSLDTAIQNESPNNIQVFLDNHPCIKKIVFNGNKAAQLYAKYFEFSPQFTFYKLPSTSPANASYSFEKKLNSWKEIVP